MRNVRNSYLLMARIWEVRRVRISVIDQNGTRTTVTDQLPTNTSAFGDILGVSDVAYGPDLYVLNWGFGGERPG